MTTNHMTVNRPLERGDRLLESGQRDRPASVRAGRAGLQTPLGGLLVLAAAVAAALVLRSTVPLVTYVMAVLASAAWRGRHGEHLQLYRQITPVILLRNAGVLLAVGTTAFALLTLGHPILTFSWYGALLAYSGVGPLGGGNAEAPFGEEGTDAVIGNLLLSPLDYTWLAVPFVLLMFFLLPRLAAVEEGIFRRGTRDWRDGVVRSVVFGLVHLTMGIPLGAALALSLGGLWFTRQYFLGGVERSAVHHLAYNLIALTALLVLLFVPV